MEELIKNEEELSLKEVDQSWKKHPHYGLAKAIAQKLLKTISITATPKEIEIRDIGSLGTVIYLLFNLTSQPNKSYLYDRLKDQFCIAEGEVISERYTIPNDFLKGKMIAEKERKEELKTLRKLIKDTVSKEEYKKLQWYQDSRRPNSSGLSKCGYQIYLYNLGTEKAEELNQKIAFLSKENKNRVRQEHIQCSNGFHLFLTYNYKQI